MRAYSMVGVVCLLTLAGAKTGIAQSCLTPEFTVTTVPASPRTSPFLFTLQQPCNYPFPPSGHIISNAAWITVRNDIWYGLNNVGIFAFDTAQNTGAARFGTITAGGLTFTVRQLGASDALPITGPAVPALSNLDTLMTNDLKEFGALGGSLAVSYQGRLVYARGFGYADLATQELVQPDSLFRLASVSKLLTMAAISNLESHSTISAASKAFTILSNITPPPNLSITDSRWNDITVDELINHTAGFLRTNVDRALDHDYLVAATTSLSQNMPGDNTSAIRYAMSKSLDYTPGHPPNPCPDCYSNFGYSILGRIVEKASGQTYENYIRNVIMAPAGVTRTRAAHTFYNQRAPGEVWYNTSSSELWGNSEFYNTNTPGLYSEGAFVYEHYDSFGGMISNTMDILRFYLYWLNWGPNSGFYGSLPGTNTGVFTLAANGDVKYSFLFNYRDVGSDYNRTNTATCTAASPCDLEVAVHNDLEAALSHVTTWPSNDLNQTYSGPNPACTFTVNPPQATIAPAGGSGLLTVVAPPNCGWVPATPTPTWITITGSPTNGNGAANYTVAPNTGATSRSSTITVANQTFNITQDGSACTINFAPTSPVSVPSAGGAKSVGLTLGAPDCGWTAASNASWITGVTASGTGNGMVNYTVAANTDVARSGTITILGQTYTINQAAGVPDTTPPFGSFDTPADNTSGVVGAVGVTGWALDNTGVSKVEIYRDAVGAEPKGNFGLVYIGAATFVTGARPDVQASYASYPNANRAGWGYMLLTNFLPNNGGSAGPGNGTFKLHAIAFDAAGNTVELGAPGKTIVCDNAHAAKPFGTIDTPDQGGSTAGSQYVNFGWALTPGTNKIATDGSTMFVTVDGQTLGHPTYNQFRNDIATAFPGFTNSQGAIGYYLIDTTKLTNGVHTVGWLVYDNGGRGEGIGSRFFTVSNGPTNVPADDSVIEPRDSVTIRRGFALNPEEEVLRRDAEGRYLVEIEELGRFELNAGVVSGYSLVGQEQQNLPIGSSFRGGVFYWQLGPAFVGGYDLVLTRPNGEAVLVRVHVRPKRYSAATQ